jgi:hypothetical protein
MNSFECLFYMSYIYTRKHHKEEISGQEISFRKSSVRGSRPRWKDTLAIDDKGGDIYQMQSIEPWFQGSNGHRGSMSDMNSILHDMTSILHHSVSINSKGVYFLLIGLFFIDVNP